MQFTLVIVAVRKRSWSCGGLQKKRFNQDCVEEFIATVP